MKPYNPYYRAQKWRMKRNGVTERDLAAVLHYSYGYTRKLLSHPGKPERVQQIEQAIEEAIRRRRGG